MRAAATGACVRRAGTADEFIYGQVLLEATAQPEELRKAILCVAARGDWVERQVTAGKDEARAVCMRMCERLWYAARSRDGAPAERFAGFQL